MRVLVEKFVPFNEQECTLGRHTWSVPRLAQLSAGLVVMDVPLAHMGLSYSYSRLTVREMAMHFKAAMEADMDCPIILDEDGEIMDGMHRIMRALFEGRETIRAVRFGKNPSPCRVREES